jgi:hypothetical protein
LQSEVLAVGAAVALRGGAHAWSSDAAAGPLKVGDAGTVVERDDANPADQQPYRVQAATGATWWYSREALQLVGGGEDGGDGEDGEANAGGTSDAPSGLARFRTLGRAVVAAHRFRRPPPPSPEPGDVAARAANGVAHNGAAAAADEPDDPDGRGGFGLGPAAAARVPPGLTACAACTFDNPAACTTCQVCDAALPAATAASAAAAARAAAAAARDAVAAAAAAAEPRVLCVAADAAPGDVAVSYLRSDLWAPLADAGRGDSWSEEMRVVEGCRRSRRECVLLLQGDEAAARRAWRAAAAAHPSAAARPAAVPVTGSDLASCLHGHFLHASCFQRALVEGQGCPACAEPFWVPRVERRRLPGAAADDDCGGGGGGGGEAAALAAAAAVEALAAETRGRGGAMPLQLGGHQLKMCPSCSAGPLLNENCADLKAHHGQCPRCGNKIINADAAIAAALASLGRGGKATVGSVLPACPNASCKGAKVFFNGCQACGHLFALDGRSEWHALPAWDPDAAAALNMDDQARKAARLLAAQVRSEAAYLAHERQALAEAANEAAGRSLLPAFRPVRPPRPPGRA